MKQLVLFSAIMFSVTGFGFAQVKKGHTKTNVMDTISANYINPPQLYPATFFSHAVKVSEGTDLLFIGGQNAVDSAGQIIGKGNVKLQAQKIIENLRTLLSASGATFNHIIKWSVYMVNGYDPAPAYELFAKEMAGRQHPPLITLVYVPRLALDDALMEVEAIAVLPKK